MERIGEPIYAPLNQERLEVRSMKIKNEILLLLLTIILLVQAYIVFVKDSRTQSGGQTAYQPSPSQYSGGFGEGQTPPAPPSYSNGQPANMAQSNNPMNQQVSVVPGRPTNTAGRPMASTPKDDYIDFLIGVILLEKSKDNALTPAQAKEMYDLISQDEQSKDLLPLLQTKVAGALNDKQKEFARSLVREDKGKAPTKAELQSLLGKVLAELQR